MNVQNTFIKDLVILEPKVFNDDRGYFFESFSQKTMHNLQLDYRFVQDNQSHSIQGVLRGLHFQLAPYVQAKLVRVLDGEILDVAVDLRKHSDTFGKWFSMKLSSENKKQLLVPRGFAHGFSVLSPTADVLYKCDNFYHKESESGIHYADPILSIDWGLKDIKPLVTDRDSNFPLFSDKKTYF